MFIHGVDKSFNLTEKILCLQLMGDIWKKKSETSLLEALLNVIDANEEFNRLLT